MAAHASHANGKSSPSHVKNLRLVIDEHVEEQKKKDARIAELDATVEALKKDVARLDEANAALSRQLETAWSTAKSKQKAEDDKIITEAKRRSADLTTLDLFAIEQKKDWAHDVALDAKQHAKFAGLYGDAPIGLAALNLQRQAERLEKICTSRLARFALAKDEAEDPS